MSKIVIDGATLSCNQGTATASLSVTSQNTTGNDKAMATVDDYESSNISGFSMCQSMSNPSVASATASAQGVLTPQSCSPQISSAWSSGCATVKIKDKKALTDDSTCSCSYGGTISITTPASSNVTMEE